MQPALHSFSRHLDKLVDLTIAVQQIPAPTFDEAKRAQFAHDFLQGLGLADVSIDEMSNVFGRLPGSTNQPPIIVSAHSDTVFPLKTDLKISRRAHFVHGPGIADNSAGVAGLLKLAETFTTYDLKAERDIWFVVNVAEEGLGDLKGMRAVTDRFADAEAFIVVEGGMYGYLLHEAIGVQRFEVLVETEGGHSWSDFGRTSAIHVLGHIINQIGQFPVQQSPKTTFNIGVIEGGTSINTIASSARFQLDLRSEHPDGLASLISRLNNVIGSAERQFDATITVKSIGDRPAGRIERNSTLVQQADAALRAVGCTKIHYLRGSTDANIPLSRGLPSVCIGLSRSANAHRLDERLDTSYLPQGMQQLLLLTLASANLVPA